MPGGIFAGPYNKNRPPGNGVWTDPTDPSVTSEQSINPIIANKPLTVSFWFKPTPPPGTKWTPQNPGWGGAPFFALERLMMDPHHNSQNGSLGIRAFCSKGRYYHYAATLEVSFEGNGSMHYTFTRGRTGDLMAGQWYPTISTWQHCIFAYEPGSDGGDRTKNYMYYNGSNAEGGYSGSNPYGIIYEGSFTSGTTIVNSIGQNGDQYNKIPGRRTFIGGIAAHGSSGGISSVANNRNMQQKEIVIWDRILSPTEVATVYNNGTSLGDKDSYPSGAKVGWIFPNGFTYDENHYNYQQDYTGQGTIKNVFSDQYGDIKSNFGRSTTITTSYMKFNWQPSKYIAKSKTARSHG